MHILILQNHLAERHCMARQALPLSMCGCNSYTVLCLVNLGWSFNKEPWITILEAWHTENRSIFQFLTANVTGKREYEKGFIANVVMKVREE